MGFLLLNALVSQKEPRLALSGHSGRLSSLLVLTQCPVMKKTPSNIPFCYNFHLLGGAISFCFSPHSSVQPGPRTVCLFRRPGPTPLHSFFSLCMICMSACTAYLLVCLSHTTYQHKGSSTEGHQYFHCIQTILSLLLLFLFLLGRSLVVVLLPVHVGFGIIKPWKSSVEYFTKKRKKRYLALVTQTIDFIVFMQKNKLFQGTLCKLRQQNGQTFFIYQAGCDFGGLLGRHFLFFVTSGLIKGLHSGAWSLLRLSIPLNKPVIAMTTVVQNKQFQVYICIKCIFFFYQLCF